MCHYFGVCHNSNNNNNNNMRIRHRSWPFFFCLFFQQPSFAHVTNATLPSPSVVRSFFFRSRSSSSGVFEADFRHSDDGVEYTFAVNVLAPYVITGRLLDLVAKAPGGGRVVNVASLSASYSLDFDNLQFEKGGYSDHASYSLSKLLDIMFNAELARRAPDGVTCNSLDPGTVNTKMLRAGWGMGGIPIKRQEKSSEGSSVYRLTGWMEFAPKRGGYSHSTPCFSLRRCQCWLVISPKREVSVPGVCILDISHPCFTPSPPFPSHYVTRTCRCHTAQTTSFIWRRARTWTTPPGSTTSAAGSTLRPLRRKTRRLADGCGRCWKTSAASVTRDLFIYVARAEVCLVPPSVQRARPCS